MRRIGQGTVGRARPGEGYSLAMVTPGSGRLIAAEFVGTTIVMLAGPGLLVIDPGVGRLELALGYGLATAIAIGVIGAVANPMFSLALWFAKSISNRELLCDWAGQVLGAIVGALLLFGLNDLDRFTTGINGWQPGDSVDTGVDLGLHVTGFANLGIVIGAELLIATLLVVILLSAIEEQRSNAVAAAFVGGGVTLAALFLAPISGVGINPARSLAMAIFADTDPNALGQVWVFVLLPMIAAFAGLFIWLAISETRIDETLLDDTFVEDIADVITGDD
jgi:aquaporin Z